MENSNIIELKHVTKSFSDGFTAVDDFNLEVRRGEFVTFLGPSGCTSERTFFTLCSMTSFGVFFCFRPNAMFS